MIAKVKARFPLLLALILLAACAAVLLIYARPMEDISMDLSLLVQSESSAGSEVFDSKGWTVYTCEGSVRTELTPDSRGAYSGLELGQTFYFSRVLSEDLDSPTLQIGTAERTFSVWLDDVLIYTDHPQLDNRIGQLRLPMNQWMRTEPIIITLPMDYQGKTLTIAQSFPEYSETGKIKAYPASVKLYCGYAYESALIAESFTTALLAAAALLAGAILLFAFARNRDWSALCLSLVAFLWMIRRLVGTSFYQDYFGVIHSAYETIVPYAATLALLLFLVLRAGRRRKAAAWLLTGYGISLAVYAAAVLLAPDFYATHLTLNMLLPKITLWLALLTMAAVLVLGWAYWRKESRFYRVFTPLALSALALHWLALIFVVEKQTVWVQLGVTVSSLQPAYVYHRVQPSITVAALAAAIYDTIRVELERRAEQRLLEHRSELALAGYEQLRLQHEEVMVLRHDMLRHFHAIREMESTDQVREYLTELIGQNQQIRSVVQSGNEMMDIILNGKLAAAVGAGIHVELPRLHVPAQLPLSDADLCSLIMNLFDNALAAAKRSGAAKPYLRLDIHGKDGYLAIVCENSSGPKPGEAKKETVPKHGLGLKIIRNITQKYEGVMVIEESGDCFKLKIVIPLS